MSYNVFAEYYDILTSNVDYDACAGFLDRQMQKYKPGCRLIADLACGTGSISIALSKKGYDVIGVDISPDMLSKARDKEQPGILWLCQDICALDLYGTIDAAVCVLDSVNHILSPALLAKAFSRVALFLEPDGLFIFDANTPYKHREILASNAFVYDTDEVFCVWQNTSKNDITEITLDFFTPQGKLYERSAEEFSERAYSRGQLDLMLAEAGFETLAVYDDYTENEPGEKSERIVFVTRKKR